MTPCHHYTLNHLKIQIKWLSYIQVLIEYYLYIKIEWNCILTDLDKVWFCIKKGLILLNWYSSIKPIHSIWVVWPILIQFYTPSENFYTPTRKNYTPKLCPSLAFLFWTNFQAVVSLYQNRLFNYLLNNGYWPHECDFEGYIISKRYMGLEIIYLLVFQLLYKALLFV